MFSSLGPPEMLVIGVVAVMLFGRRLPEVGRSLGKGIVEFKKGLQGVDDDESPATTSTTTTKLSSSGTSSESYAKTDLGPATSVPKFEPPTSAPVAESAPVSASQS